MPRTGRPRKEIDVSQFKKLCNLQCTETEIAGFFDCSVDTIDRFCKREFKTTFADAFKKLSAGGKISLRRNAFRLAETNPAVCIFLLKNFCGMSDHAEEDTGEKVTVVIDV